MTDTVDFMTLTQKWAFSPLSERQADLVLILPLQKVILFGKCTTLVCILNELFDVGDVRHRGLFT